MPAQALENAGIDDHVADGGHDAGKTCDIELLLAVSNRPVGLTKIDTDVNIGHVRILVTMSSNFEPV
ncbi:hypothetical protein [Sphingomonas sp. PP-CE-1G-424]|uniref:hypothetical protein n=1 Tax=Sphingomonas sp. PP-CE-1G-424 TaxID=2135658 RepID=UPI001056D0F3|nr:hypothetical protein [Sphingomonas sp. PP-CE-1G-424]